MNPKSTIRLVILIGSLTGLTLLIFGFAYPTSQSITVEHIDTFDNEYISEYNETEGVKIVYNDIENVTPEQIHVTYNRTEFTNTTIGKMKDIINTNKSFSVEKDGFNVTETGERFILNIDDPNEQVYATEGGDDGSILVSIVGGLIIMFSISLAAREVKREDMSNEVEPSDDEEWKYTVK